MVVKTGFRQGSVIWSRDELYHTHLVPTVQSAVVGAAARKEAHPPRDAGHRRMRGGGGASGSTTPAPGPGGGTPKKPVGLTYIGISWDGGCLVRRQVYPGTRDDVRRRASAGVVWMLFDRLNS